MNKLAKKSYFLIGVKFIATATLFVMVAGICSSEAKAQTSKAAPAATASAKDSEQLTFSEDIAPIVFQNCSVCHRPGQTAPFSLLNYSDVKKHANSIVRATQSKYMPPWKPTKGFGEFSNERFLSDQQIASIKAWVAQGCKEGDVKKMPPAPSFSSDWRLGPPDAVLKVKDVFTVPADGPDIYRAFVIPTNFPEIKYVSALEYRTTNNRVMHHALFFEDVTGAARKKDAEDKLPGYTAFGGPGFLPASGLGGWSPGNIAPPLPDGIGRPLFKNSDMVIQVHYHPTGKEEKEQSELGLYFTKTAPKNLLLTLMAASRNIDIKAGDSAYKVHVEATAPVNVRMIAITPHAHLICRSIKATAKLPDGTVVPLIWIKDWDFRWQGQYTLAKPLSLPKGTVVSGDFIYDNSEQNQANPNSPPKEVRWGEQTTDEMAILFCGVVAENPADIGAFRRAQAGKHVGVLLKNPAMIPELQKLREAWSDVKLSK